jgi:hypothetical protein
VNIAPDLNIYNLTNLNGREAMGNSNPWPFYFSLCPPFPLMPACAKPLRRRQGRG